MSRNICSCEGRTPGLPSVVDVLYRPTGPIRPILITMTNLIHRPRRLRRSAAIRLLVREARLSRDDFVLPLFVCAGKSVRREVSSMPGVFNLSVDEVTEEASSAFDKGVRSVILFGLPEAKDELASGAYAED